MIANVVRWHPLRDIDNFFNPYYRLETKRAFDWSPSVDVVEDDQEFVIKVELPGVKKEDIEVATNEHVLTISGQRKSEEKDEKNHRAERFYGSFSRSFTLPDNVDEAEIYAKNKEGMLYVHLPKAQETKSKSLKVDIK